MYNRTTRLRGGQSRDSAIVGEVNLDIVDAAESERKSGKLEGKRAVPESLSTVTSGEKG